jgi:hypothetical protein
MVKRFSGWRANKTAKHNSHPYLPQHTNWLKVPNHGYSQWQGREELFERERATDPEFELWKSFSPPNLPPLPNEFRNSAVDTSIGRLRSDHFTSKL